MKIFIIVLLVLLGVFIFIREVEKKVVFFPMRQVETTPAAYGMAYLEPSRIVLFGESLGGAVSFEHAF